MATHAAIAAGLLIALVGCAGRDACLMGVEVGAESGRFVGAIRSSDTTYVGGHVTMTFEVGCSTPDAE